MIRDSSVLINHIDAIGARVTNIMRNAGCVTVGDMRNHLNGVRIVGTRVYFANKDTPQMNFGVTSLNRATDFLGIERVIQTPKIEVGDFVALNGECRSHDVLFYGEKFGVLVSIEDGWTAHVWLGHNHDFATCHINELIYHQPDGW